MNDLERKIHERLKYDKDTGLITWKKTFAARAREGEEAGSNDGHGYKRIGISGRKIHAHRLAWFIHYGVWPKVIEHINGDRIDNRIENLRDVNFSDNAKNRKLQKSKSGIAGVFHDKKTGRYQVGICVKGRSIHLGMHDDLEVALKIREAALNAYGFHENHCKR